MHCNFWFAHKKTYMFLLSFLKLLYPLFVSFNSRYREKMLYLASHSILQNSLYVLPMSVVGGLDGNR